MNNKALTPGIAAALGELEENYKQRTPNSRSIMLRSSEVMPGGETRSTLYFSPYPLVFRSGESSTLTDVDGHLYRDFINDFGGGLYGHSQPLLQQAIKQVVDDGLTLGGINQYEGELARLLVERFPALEKVRFTNSGTEASLMAITTARLFTGRDKILVMSGGYHGGVLTLLDPASRSIAPYDFVYGTFNDLAKTEHLVAECGDELAAIFIEPVLGAGGMLPAELGYLQGLRELANRTGALLIFDEVQSSRMGPTGAQGIYGVTPDLMTCAKYLGGGGNFGAFGGRADVMNIYDYSRPDPVKHGGTFNNNVITMAAGAAGLRDIFTPEVATKLLNTGNQFRAELNAICQQQGVAMTITGLGPSMAIHFQPGPITTVEQAFRGKDPSASALLHMAMLERGIYLARRGGLILSIVQTDADLTFFRQAFTEVLQQYGDLFNEYADIVSR